MILVFSAFTFNPSFRCIQSVIEYMTRLALASLLTAITQSSAYLTNRSPRFSNSLSSSFSMMFDRSGDRFPPCGVPLSVFSYLPCTITPAFRYFRISDPVSPSFMMLCTRLISLSCGTLSKNFSKSISTIHSYPPFRNMSISLTAISQLRLGRNP